MLPVKLDNSASAAVPWKNRAPPGPVVMLFVNDENRMSR